jgi:hypothetical protein
VRNQASVGEFVNLVLVLCVFGSLDYGFFPHVVSILFFLSLACFCFDWNDGDTCGSGFD